MARHSSYNSAIAGRIVADIAAGVPMSSALATNGVCARTGFYWLHRYPVFAARVERAKAIYQKNRQLELHT